jgi:hypothetical protein
MSMSNHDRYLDSLVEPVSARNKLSASMAIADEREPTEPTEEEKVAFDSENVPERFQADWELCPF